MELHYSYIIESLSTQKWYYGYTTDLVIRLDTHNKGLNVSTRSRGPWKYIFIRHFETKTEALNSLPSGVSRLGDSALIQYDFVP